MAAGGVMPPSAASAAVGLAPDLRKRVEIMAEHVARNGVDFENTVKQKNAGNPQFAFLLPGGEGSEYYAQLLQAHRGTQVGGVAGQAEAADLAELLRRWKEPPVHGPTPEADRQLHEIVASLEHMASRDAIRNGRAWIEANAGMAHSIAGNLMKKIVYLPTCAHRLHVLFLLHDVLQSDVVKQENARCLIAAFKPYLVWMLRPSYQLAQSISPNGEDSMKILKLLQLWSERGILSAREAEEVKAIITATDLPNAVPLPQQAQGTHLAGQPIAPHLSYPQGLVQQVGAQVGAHTAQARPGAPQQNVVANMLGALQQLPLTKPAIGVPPVPGTAGIHPLTPVPPFRPALPPAVPGRGSQTPETVHVGIMAAMLKQVSKRGKDLHTAFVPYKPLDPLYTPQAAPPTAPPSERLLERLREFYEIVGDTAKEEKPLAITLPPPPETGTGEKRDSKQRSRSRSRSRSPPLTTTTAAIPLALPDGSVNETPETPRFQAVPPPAVD